MNLEVKIFEDKEQSILRLAGEIDAYTVPKLKESFDTLLKQNAKAIIVDMVNVTYMDSTGLGVFISVLKTVKEEDSELRLINIQERVLRLFQITGLDEMMDLNTVIRGEKE